MTPMNGCLVLEIKVTQAEYDKIIEIIESSYHRASGQYHLPRPEDAAYDASAIDGKHWSCPMRPDEIAARFSDAFYKTILDDEPVS